MLFKNIFELREELEEVIGHFMYELAQLCLEKAWRGFVKGKSWLVAVSSPNFNNKLMKFSESGGEKQGEMISDQSKEGVLAFLEDILNLFEAADIVPI